MSERARPGALGRWLRRYSLTLVAAVGGAAGVAYAATSRSASAVVVEPDKPIAPALPRDDVQDTVQIALLLDTSSSMDGLLNQARSQLWSLVDQMGRMTRVVDGKRRGVRIQLALYEYGNDTLSAKSGYIRQVLPFTTDLDSVSEKLQALFTNGGSEFVGQAIDNAVTSLTWSSDPSTMRFIFVAGNEEFDQGPISAATAMGDAAGRDIHVQLIYCGNKESSWAAAARLARTDLMSIDQNQVAAYVPAPQDAEILRLGNELNGTYFAYGGDGAASIARQAAADASSARLSPKVALERAQLKSKNSYDNSNWDLIDANRTNARFFEETAEDQLPAELRGKTLDEKRAIVAAKTAAREALQRQIAKLEAERTRFLDAERSRNKTAADSSLETELMRSTKQIASQKGYQL